MVIAREHLVAAIEETRPLVLFLGQSAWVGVEGRDSVLEQALDRLERSSESRNGWPTLTSSTKLPPEFYEWLAERFAARVPPASLTTVGDLPWSAVFTSAIDPTLPRLFEGGVSGAGRRERVVGPAHVCRSTRSAISGWGPYTRCGGVANRGSVHSLRRRGEPAARAGCAAESCVERRQRAGEHLGQRDVPGIVAGQVTPQRPYALGERRKRIEVDIQTQQVPMCARGLEP